MNLPLFVGVGNFNWLQDPGWKATDSQVVEGEAGIALEAANHDRIELLAIRFGSS